MRNYRLVLIIMVIINIVFLPLSVYYYFRNPPAQAPEISVIKKSASEKINRTSKEAPSVKAEMIYIPPGEFLMGSDEYPNEAPLRKVYTDAYYIDKYPVTNAQYNEFLSKTGYVPEVQGVPYRAEGKDNHPITRVSWNDAAEYAKWAGKRLPTEAEWEKAARGTDGRVFPWGNDPDLSRLNISGKGTSGVDAFPEGKSPYGVMDMAGNAFEWTADRISPDKYGEFGYMFDGHENKKPPYIIKGGCFLYRLRWCRSPFFFIHESSRGAYILGFRCAMSANPEKQKKETGEKFWIFSQRKKGYGCNIGQKYEEALRQTLGEALHPDRLAQAERYVEFMGLKPGDSVADIGCGIGFPSIYLSSVVGRGGAVYAVDINKDVLDFIDEAAKISRIDNIETVLSTPTDVSLPPESVDNVFCINTYGYMITNYDDLFGKKYEESAVPFLAGIRKALRRGGKLAIFNSIVTIKPDRAIRQIEKNGFKFITKEYPCADGHDRYYLLFKKR